MTTTDQCDGKTEPTSMRPAGIFRPLGFWASLLWFVTALVVSFVAVWLRWRSDSIIPSMLSHASTNVAALISFALET
jgi:membrane protease YdiL (CAAX protease family)